MKGDFSKLRFNPANHYTSVLQQQGRVSLDSDANEQALIDESLRAEEITDIVGTHGGPKHDCGFRITFDDITGLNIGPGRYYVDGIVCENDKKRLYTDQPWLSASLDEEKKLFTQLERGDITTLQVYLQVWKRLVTSLDDSCLREPALGMADTTARLQTVWQVILNPIYPAATTTTANDTPVFIEPTRMEPAGFTATIDNTIVEEDDRILLNHVGATPLTEATPSATDVRAPSETVSAANGISQNTIGNQVTTTTSCCRSMTLTNRVANPGKLWARTSDTGDDCSCEPTPASGYRGLENQLYRVEIHTSGDATEATFKWSRENASVVTAITSVSGKQVFVTSLGPDANLGFNHNDWVEISDDTDLFANPPNQPGALYQIDSISRENLSITLKTVVGAVHLGRNPRLRRWDQTAAGEIAIARNQWFTLENGIEIQFAAGAYTSGDYWLIPARTATGNIEWPPCGSEGGKWQPPLTIPIYYAPLACITLDDRAAHAVVISGSPFTVQDCRKCFSPLTALTPPAKPTAIHVTEISWLQDDFLTADALVERGLLIAFDQELASPITGANFIVTLELIDQPSDKREGELVESWSILRQLFLLETSGDIVPKNVAASGSTKASSVLRWRLPYLPDNANQVLLLSRLSALLNSGAQDGRFARVRIRLVGRNIFYGRGVDQIFLDGQVFGQAGTRPDGSDRINLTLPSGNGEKASDFESWFYLAPELLIDSISAEPTTTQNGVALDGSATVTLSYAPVSAVTVALTLTIQNSTVPASNYITLATRTLHFAAGQTSQSVNLKVIQQPPQNTVETFQLTATLKHLVGLDSVLSTTFTLGYVS